MDATHRVDVRELAERDVELIARTEPEGKGFVEAMWRLQQEGLSLLLVAWVGADPVGSGQLDWRSTPPELKNLHVDARHRGSGIGTSIIREAEIRMQPGSSLAVGVGLDNPRARALYERLGYSATGEISTTTYEYVDDGGTRRQATETDELLVKSIR
ncbi:GNAT family N-acetyltransferase [Microbacterium sp. NEAU-LLC]|uniref:GNAT family N-acetyltransferase n=1 Tax=Microbacterium helvum TaxID=2773713 RepID=A0ABR8NLK2_9MICO|nr:GNAT family N-acetyltransferase [Microbacterium helvum]MBD3940657.1 GNAT family N-acetyltransferase [Microbacterium helvum]